MLWRWHVWLSAALICALPLTAAGLDDAARNLARRVLAVLEPGEIISLETRSLADATAVAPLESLLSRALSTRLRARPTAALVVTISENVRGPLLVAELRRDENPVVMLAPYDAPAARAAAPAPTLALESRLVIEQEEPILDVALHGANLAVLERSRLAFHSRDQHARDQARDQDEWRERRALPLAPPATSRDLRGRLVIEGESVRAYLPRMLCRARFSGDDPLECDQRTGEWPLFGGSTILLPATLAPGRNYFESPPLPSFFTAARWGGHWAIATVNGSALLVDADGRTLSTLGEMGSDITAIDSPCSGEAYLVGHRHGAFYAFRIDAEKRALPATEPLKLSGRLAAVWPAEQSTSFTAIVQSAESGRYAAYRVSLACGR